ncbi:MAG: hypothetical protein M3460_10525 [Actinomycetota bacterium]|nr:hypothetical protein [Actinomycetota bacterium]
MSLDIGSQIELLLLQRVHDGYITEDSRQVYHRGLLLAVFRRRPADLAQCHPRAACTGRDGVSAPPVEPGAGAGLLAATGGPRGPERGRANAERQFHRVRAGLVSVHLFTGDALAEGHRCG